MWTQKIVSTTQKLCDLTDPKDESYKIDLAVQDNDNTKIHFRMSYMSSFERLMDKVFWTIFLHKYLLSNSLKDMIQFLQYSHFTGIPWFKLRFMFDGQRVQARDTPKCLEMEQDDILEVFQMMQGGNRNDQKALKVLTYGTLC